MKILYLGLFGWMIWEYHGIRSLYSAMPGCWGEGSNTIKPHFVKMAWPSKTVENQGLCPWRPVWENRGSISMRRVRLQAELRRTDPEVDQDRKMARLPWRFPHNYNG